MYTVIGQYTAGWVVPAINKNAHTGCDAQFRVCR